VVTTPDLVAGPAPVRLASGRRSLAARAALDADGVLHVVSGPSGAERQIDLWCVDALAHHRDARRVVVEVTERGTNTTLTFDPGDGPLAQCVLDVLADIAGPSDD